MIDILFQSVDKACAQFCDRLKSSTYMDSPAGELFQYATHEVALGASLACSMGDAVIGGLMNGLLDSLLFVVGMLEAPAPEMSFPEPVLLNTPAPPPGFAMQSDIGMAL